MRRLGHAWQRFWFKPEPTSSLALLRIAFGLVAFGWGVSLLPDLQAFFSAQGIEPDPVQGSWGLLGSFDSTPAIVALYVALLVGALCVVLGYHTRVASVVLFVAIFSFLDRTPSVFNSGDALLRNLAFFLMFAPAGASLSIDRWRTARERFWEFPARAPWALRLIQVQISVIYLSAAWAKLDSEAWTDGTALSYVLRLEDFERFSVPDVLGDSILLSTVASYWTIAVELMIGILVWNRAVRPLVLALGAGLHVSIDLTLRIGFFSALMLVAYIAFLSPALASAGLLTLRDRLLTVRDRLLASTPRGRREHGVLRSKQ